MAGLASITQVGGVTAPCCPLPRITFKSRLNHLTIFSVKLHSRARDG